MSEDVTLPDATSRRDFIRKGTAAAVALPAVVSLAACSESKAAAKTPSAPADTSARATAPAAPALTARQKADAMDAMHEKGVKAFPAKTAGKGNQLLSPGSRRASRSTSSPPKKIQWETEPGRRVRAWAYNEQVPGPQIRVREGDRVRVKLDNRAARVDRDPLPRPRAAQRPGRRAVHHPAAGQAGRELHLRVHGPERRLAHVPLAPQRGEAGGPRAARRVHRRAEAASAPSTRPMSTT